MEKPYSLIGPVILVAFPQLQVKAPDDLGEDQVHFCPSQATQPCQPGSKIHSTRARCSPLAQAIAGPDHEWLVGVLSVRIESRVGIFEPPLRIEDHWL